MLTKIQNCPNSHSINIVKNGHRVYGAQRCWCHGYGKTRGLNRKSQPEQLDCISRSFRERLSLRGICRVFKVSFYTLYTLLHLEIQSLPDFRRSVVEVRHDDVLELDELCSSVESKVNKRWLWVVLNRRNRQVVTYVIGDRSSQTFK